MAKTLEEKIQAKETEVAKLVKKFDSQSKLVSEEFLALINQYLENGNYKPIREYKERTYPGSYYLKGNDYDLYYTADQLYEARNTLAKHIKQLKAQEDKANTLKSLPESIIKFREDLITRWDRFDEFKKEKIREQYREAEKLVTNGNSKWDEFRQAEREIQNKWGSGWYNFMYLTSEEIHKSNVKDADSLVLNMIDRVIEKTGTITDTQYLNLDRDNSGYTIINGKIIGESGTATITSIGAGGYNIQRYHIRVLVK